jgi:hypothetical protein
LRDSNIGSPILSKGTLQSMTAKLMEKSISQGCRGET